jgi:hypothetical protein
MMKPLPLKHWLAIEEDVARHKAEIAQGFADLRAKLLPEPPERPKPTQADFWRGMLNSEQQRNLARLQSQAQAPCYRNPFVSSEPAGADLLEALIGFPGRKLW